MKLSRLYEAANFDPGAAVTTTMDPATSVKMITPRWPPETWNLKDRSGNQAGPLPSTPGSSANRKKKFFNAPDGPPEARLHYGERMPLAGNEKKAIPGGPD